MLRILRATNQRVRIMLLIFFDILMVQIASALAIYIRYDFNFSDIPAEHWESMLEMNIYRTAIVLVVFAVFKLYKSVWSYASVYELAYMACACITIFTIDVILAVIRDNGMPRSFYPMFIVLLGAGCASIRFSYRLARMIGNRFHEDNGESRNVMIIGAGAAGLAVLKEIKESEYLDYKVKCLVDDNKYKHGKYLLGVKIVGGRYDIIKNAYKYNIQKIIIAIPTLDAANKKEILEICNETDCEMQILPGMYQIMNDDVKVSMLREVNIEDLLGREPIHLQNEKISGYVTGKVVMVTGGGGSIGSELCRQIAINKPKQLIIVDIYENNAYDIQQELKSKYPELDLVVLIASVRNTDRINYIFEKYRPNIVYHAAAHKHVPLMEDSPNEAIKNNVFGTYKTAMAAGRCGVERFVLISTDKAVNPTNIMGASKRICEMIIQMMDKKFEKTNFVAVRFGNVLGSNGSVIPLFKKQIEAGGPVTVTDPRIIRYFMTIPEAVSLVLEAGAYAKGGEIFVLDMGQPVKIIDMAKNLIKLSGYKNGEIEIKITGLRPGEKLYEELLMDEEGLKDTENKLIHIGRPIEFDEAEFEMKLEELKEVALGEYDDTDKIRRAVKDIVPTYKMKEKVDA